MKIYPITIPGGSDSYIQYNNGGIFGGDSTFTLNDSTKMVTASGLTLNGTQTYGIDLSGGTWSSGVMNWDANPDVYAGGTKIIGFDDTNYNMLFGTGVFANDNGQQNIGIGYQAGYYNSTVGAANYGDGNLYIGYQSGMGNVAGSTANVNIGIGYQSLYSVTSGNSNIAIGREALKNCTSGNTNTAIGSATLYELLTTNYNVAIGYHALQNNQGTYNTAIGTNAMYLALGNSNTAIGYGAGQGSSGKTYFSCTYIGTDCGRVKQTGNFDTAIGYRAAYSITTGLQNTFIGTYSGYSTTTGGNNVYMGFSSGYRQTTNSNLLIIDNQDRGSTANELAISLIYGTFAATAASQALRINAATFTLNGGVDTDITCNFIGTTNSGAFKWDEDNDYFEYDDDIVFVGDAVGLPYGDMYTNSTIAVVISDNNPTEIKDATNDGFTAGEVHRVTFPTGGDEHYLSVDVAGRYRISYSVTYSQNSPSSAINIESGVMVGGVAQNPGRSMRTVANSTDIGNMGGTCILDLAASAQVSLYVTNETNTTNIDVEHANLTLVHVGGT